MLRTIHLERYGGRRDKEVKEEGDRRGPGPLNMYSRKHIKRFGKGV